MGVFSPSSLTLLNNNIISPGTKTSKFWSQVEAPAVQAAKDLGVQLDVTRFDIYNPDTMAAAVRSIISNPPDALIVSIPAAVVAEAVRDVISAGIPVFGLNSGYEYARDLGVLTWVAQDEAAAGAQAATTFLEIVPGIAQNAPIAYVNDQPGNTGFQDRLAGFNSHQPLIDRGLSAQELNLDPSLPKAPQLATLLGSCSYDFVLLASSGNLEDTLAALSTNGCATKVASFDESNTLFDGIRSGSVEFGMSQQKNLQGMLPVIFAATYVTTGKVPAVPSRNLNGIYLSNGAPWTSERVPSLERQLCIEDSFPVCPTVGANGCPCFDRSTIRIGGVVHGDTKDRFWDNAFAGAAVAAGDMGIELDFQRLNPSANAGALVTKMKAALARLCTGANPVDALFVSIPNDSVIPAITQCRDAGIPIIAINSGAQQAEDLGLQHFIGQLEFNAGFSAAQRLLAAGMVRGFCLNHNPAVQTLTQRCEGFRAAFETAAGAEFVAEVIVNPNDVNAYRTTVEQAVGDVGTWSGNGFLLTGSAQATAGLGLVESHPDALIGTFDNGQVIFDALQSGQFQFGINQQPYFQGYLPIPLLTAQIQTNRQLLNFFIESGPKFLSTPPGASDQICVQNSFQVCGEPAQCGNYDDACNIGSDCCSDRCFFNTCQKRVPVPKGKIAASAGRGGAAGAIANKPGTRRIRRMQHNQ
jgi:simple sugar transport system substrate-binding protein